MLIIAMTNVGYFIYAMEVMIMSLIAAETEFECVSGSTVSGGGP